MFNFLDIIPRAAQAAGDTPVLAASYPLSESLCRGLVSAGVIRGFVANQRPEQSMVEPAIAGWWVDQPAGTWFIRGAAGKTLIVLGATRESKVGVQALLEARLKGVRRLLLVGEDGIP